MFLEDYCVVVFGIFKLKGVFNNFVVIKKKKKKFKFKFFDLEKNFFIGFLVDKLIFEFIFDLEK